jgi:hypothetical protein
MTLQKRIALFLTGCFGTRLALVYAAKVAKPAVLEVLGAIALLPAVGFFYIYITGARKTGPEVFGDKIWWNHMRPFHGFMYALFAVMALFHIPYAWTILLLDTFVGFGAFVNHHFLGLQ